MGYARYPEAAGGDAGECQSQTGDDAGDAAVHSDVRNSCPPPNEKGVVRKQLQNHRKQL
jgi:hypothetical protein